MPNHFHYLIEIKDKKEIYKDYLDLEFQKEKPNIKFEKDLEVEKFVMQQFSNLFNCSTNSFNKKFKRKGALYIDYLRRTEISSEEYLRNSILYILQNPIHHKFCNRIDDWKYSSYKSFSSNKFTLLEKNEVLNWFGNLENFIFVHTTLKNLDY